MYCLFLINLDFKTISKAFSTFDHNTTYRPSDGKANINGRFNYGFFPSDACANFTQSEFFRYFNLYQKNYGVSHLFRKGKMSTGFTTDYKNKLLYWTDKCRGLTYVFKWNKHTGQIFIYKQTFKIYMHNFFFLLIGFISLTAMGKVLCDLFDGDLSLAN